MNRPDGDLRRIMRDKLPHIHWSAIESPITSTGIPDAHGCWKGIDFFIECKWTAGWLCTLRPFQVAWLTRRARAGGRCFVAVRRVAEVGARREAADEFWLFDGALARELKLGGLRAVAPIELQAGGPGAWDWRQIEARLLAPPARTPGAAQK